MTDDARPKAKERAHDQVQMTKAEGILKLKIRMVGLGGDPLQFGLPESGLYSSSAIRHV
jgi:hypothetical protein